MISINSISQEDYAITSNTELNAHSSVIMDGVFFSLEVVL